MKGYGNFLCSTSFLNNHWKLLNPLWFVMQTVLHLQYLAHLIYQVSQHSKRSLEKIGVVLKKTKHKHTKETRIDYISGFFCFFFPVKWLMTNHPNLFTVARLKVIDNDHCTAKCCRWFPMLFSVQFLYCISFCAYYWLLSVAFLLLL